MPLPATFHAMLQGGCNHLIISLGLISSVSPSDDKICIPPLHSSLNLIYYHTTSFIHVFNFSHHRTLSLHCHSLITHFHSAHSLFHIHVSDPFANVNKSLLFLNLVYEVGCASDLAEYLCQAISMPRQEATQVTAGCKWLLDKMD